MKKALRIISCSLLAIIFTTTLSGCAQKTTVSKDLVVWSFESEDTWKPVIKNFQQKNKGYTVTYVKQQFNSGYENRVLNSILSGAGPDVWAMPNDWVYRHKDKLTPMPDSLSKTIDLDKQFVPSIKQSVFINNKIYALAPSAEPLMVYYNPKLFTSALQDFNNNNKGDTEGKKNANALLQAPPKTWSEFTEAVNLLTIKDGSEIGVSGVALGTDKIANAQDILYLLMMQNETSILSDDIKQATFNLPKATSTGTDDNPGVRALEFYTSFADPSSENYSWNDSLGDNIEAFANEKAAMIFGFSSLQNTLAQKYPNLKFKKAYAPQLDQDSAKITDFAKFNAYGVNKLSKSTAASWSLINILTSTANSGFITSTHLYTSQKASSYDLSIKARTGTSPEKLSLPLAKSLVKGRYPDEFDMIMKNAIASVATGTQDPQSALDAAASKATELLRKTDW